MTPPGHPDHGFEYCLTQIGRRALNFMDLSGVNNQRFIMTSLFLKMLKSDRKLFCGQEMRGHSRGKEPVFQLSDGRSEWVVVKLSHPSKKRIRGLSWDGELAEL